MHEYEVEATRAVAEEMARYDDAELKQLGFVSLGLLHLIVDEQNAKMALRKMHPEEHMQEARDTMLVYRWHLASEHPPTKERWLSFGVRVEDA